MIRPKPASATIGLQHLMIVEPLELEVLAALTAPEDEVEIRDMILEKTSLEQLILDFRPDVFCTTGYITHIPVMKEICRLAKKLFPDVRTIAGGVHVEKFPEDADDPAIDFRVVRNATRTFPQLLQHLKYGWPLPAAALPSGQALRPETLPDFDFFFPHPRRELTRRYRSRYFYVFHNKVALLKTSFGCPYTCNFCFCRKITDGQYFARPMDDVIAELKSIKEKEIYIVDDDFLLSSKRVRAFIDQLKAQRLDKKFLVYGRADFIIKYPELIRDFRKAGLRTVIVGLESFKDEELAGFEKRTDRHTNEEALRILNRYGINCYAAVIVSPDWTKEDFRQAGDIMLSLGIKFVNLQPLTPLKGTGVEVDDSNLVIDRQDFPRWDLAHVAIRPQHMSLKSYYEEIFRLYERISYHPKNLLYFALHFSPRMQWKLSRGLQQVRRQYLERIQKAEAYAQNTIHSGHPA